MILLDVDFFDKESLPNHHHFLNEARLTAIAISIYLTSILVMPQKTPFKILVLDDILIGLDMSNRMPLLDILEKHFSEYQIFITTHDKKWYEAVKLTLDHSKWQFVEMYTKKEHQNGFEIPVVKCGDQTDFIPTAEHYLNEGDLKAAAVYVRTAFEQILVRCCNKKHLPVRFHINPSKITSEDLWQAVKGSNSLEQTLCNKVQSCRSLVMNPFTHYDLQNPQFRSELENAIEVTKELKGELSA